MLLKQREAEHHLITIMSTVKRGDDMVILNIWSQVWTKSMIGAEKIAIMSFRVLMFSFQHANKLRNKF